MLEYCQKNDVFENKITIAESLCQTKAEKMCLVKYIVESGVSGYSNWIASIYLETREDEKYLEVRKANLSTISGYLDLIKYYDSREKKDLALKTALKGLERLNSGIKWIFEYLFKFYSKKHDGEMLENLYSKAMKKCPSYEKSEITKLMYNYYKENSNYEKMKNLMPFLTTTASYNDMLDWYRECQKELTSADFELYDKQVLKTIKKRNLSAYLNICLDKGNKKEVLEYLQNNRYGIDTGHYFSKQLLSEYPKEIVELYWKEAQDFADMGKCHNYDHCVSVLSSIKKIMKNNKWENEWEIKFENFLKKNKRKRLLVERIIKME